MSSERLVSISSNGSLGTDALTYRPAARRCTCSVSTAIWNFVAAMSFSLSAIAWTACRYCCSAAADSSMSTLIRFELAAICSWSDETEIGGGEAAAAGAAANANDAPGTNDASKCRERDETRPETAGSAFRAQRSQDLLFPRETSPLRRSR